MKVLSYRILDSDFTKEIKIYSHLTKDNSQKLIADDLKVKENIIKIINCPNEQTSKPYNNNIYLEITFENCIHDVVLYLPKGNTIKLKDAYKMQFTDIIKALKNKGVYFSESCIKSGIKILVSGQIIQNKIFPFLGLSRYDTAKLEIAHDTITIKHDDKIFTLSNYEYASAAYKLMDEAFPSYWSIKIFHHKIKLKKKDILEKKEKYKIEVIYDVCVSPLYNGSESYQCFDHLPTIRDLQKRISKVYFDEKVKPKKIEIFNENIEPINDRNAQLDSIQNIVTCTFYFWFKQKDKELKTKTKDSIEIFFKMKPKGENNYIKFSETFQVELTIGEIQQLIKNANHIEDDVIIKNRDKRILNKDYKIKNILDQIEQKVSDKKTLYKMYVDIIPVKKQYSKESRQDQQLKKTKDQISPKKISTLDDDDDSMKVTEKPIDKADPFNQTITKKEFKLQIDKEDDDQEVEETPKKIDDDRKLRKPIPISKYRPKVTEIFDSSLKIEPEANKRKYKFIFDNHPKYLKLDDNSTLLDNEEKIKSIYNISPSKEIKFIYIKNDEEELIVEKIREMKTFSKGEINIVLINQEKDQVKTKTKSKEKCYLYHYQTNINANIEEIELDKDATVETMKNNIAQRYNVKVSNIKILFSGKDLLNSILLESLDVGDFTLFAYIRSENDILLLTAKALKVVDYSDDIEEEEEYVSN